MTTEWRGMRSWIIRWPCTLTFLCLSIAPETAASPPDSRPLQPRLPGLSAPAPPDAKESEAAGDEKPNTLDQLLEMACQHSPDLAIARARAEAARGRLIQAGLYLNPTFTWEGEDVGHRGNAAGNEGPVIGQEIITAGKRRLAQAAAAHGVTAADWQALTRWYDVLTRTRLTYFDLLTARQEVLAAEEIVTLARENLAAAQKLIKAGVGVKPDELRAQVELDQSSVQRDVAEQRLRAAGQLLGAAVGVPDLNPASVEGTFPEAVPDYEWQTALATMLTHSAPVQEAQALVLQGEELHRLARAEKCPNVRLQVRPLYAFPDRQTEVTVWVGAALPIFNRNQGNILAAEADWDRTRAELRAVELRLRERLAGAFQRYQAARRQTEAYQKQVLPNARESLRLIRVGYEKGEPKYDFTAVQQAQRTLAQARLVYVQSLGELWRAVSEIAGLLQQDDGCFSGAPAACRPSRPTRPGGSPEELFGAGVAPTVREGGWLGFAAEGSSASAETPLHEKSDASSASGVRPVELDGHIAVRRWVPCSPAGRR